MNHGKGRGSGQLLTHLACRSTHPTRPSVPCRLPLSLTRMRTRRPPPRPHGWAAASGGRRGGSREQSMSRLEEGSSRRKGSEGVGEGRGGAVKEGGGR